MPRTIYLPDGKSLINVPDNATQEQIDRATDQHFMNRAGQEGPISINNKVYSGSAAYPNTYAGHTLAWLDTHAGGDALAHVLTPAVQAGDQATGGAVSRAVDAYGRAITANPISAGSDLIGSGENALLDYFSPGQGPRYSPIVPASREALGVKEVAPGDTGQKFADAALAGAFGGGLTRAISAAPGAVTSMSAPIVDALYGMGSEATGEVGENVAGGPGRATGALLPAFLSLLTRGAARLGGAKPPPTAQAPTTEFEPPNRSIYQTSDPRQPFYEDLNAPSEPVSGSPSSASVTEAVAPAAEAATKSWGQQAADAAIRYALAHGASGSSLAGLVAAGAPLGLDATRAALGRSAPLGSFAYGPASINWPPVVPQMVNSNQQQQQQ